MAIVSVSPSGPLADALTSRATPALIMTTPQPRDLETTTMAVLTNLESKLGEVTGLAMAAQVATKTVIRLAKSDARELVPDLERMRDDAAETERRCTALASTFEGKKTAILEEARATKTKGADMLKIYLDAESDSLDGFEFLTMIEAGEHGHWNVLGNMNAKAPHRGIAELVKWSLPIQLGHYQGALAASKLLAAADDPNEPA
jgi:hypothetical protein